MLLHNLLNERILNLTTPHQKAAHANEVWDLLQQAYQKIGGFKSAASVDELVHETGLWKLVLRNGTVTAANIYKDAHGRKTIASGTNGSTQGKADYQMVKKDDLRYKRAWAEVSGPVEKVMIKSGAEPIPARFAEFLTGKKVLEFAPDGFHYTRLIAGHPHEKVIYGFVNLTDDDINRLSHLGFSIHELPVQFITRGG